jgi:Domain of unknown function (DUF4384)
MTRARRIGWLLGLVSCAHRAPPSAPSTASSELTLEVTPSVSGLRHATLRSGDQVVSGDGIQIAVKPTTDAHVYVAYCDRNHQLAIFPSVGSIEAKAGMVTYAPARNANIVLDDQVGPEVLYVIASRRPLDVADPALAAAIARAGQDPRAECGAPFDRALDQGRSAEVHDAPASPAPPGRPRPPHASPPRVPPPADLQRGGFLRWGAMGTVSADGDRDDIVVLRYAFLHVAPDPTPGGAPSLGRP